MKDIKFIIVAGYVASGSSAVTDLLKEYKGIKECGAEIRFIKDPYGLMELENAIFNNWELNNASTAIWDFLDQSKKWCRYGKNPFSPSGMSYKKLINKNYYKITEEFVNNITEFRFLADTYSDGFRKNYFRFVSDRIRRFLEKKSKGKLKIANRRGRKNYFPIMNRETFYYQTREYINALFEPFALVDGCQFVVLDQAISPNNTHLLTKYFNDAKLIIVDRDPRDIFVENIRTVDYITNNPNSIESAEKFVSLFKALRNSQVAACEESNVLRINFEDLIIQYETTSNKILSFIGGTDLEHVSPFKYLIPNKSKINVGIWKSFYDEYKISIDYITEKLKEYCKDY